MFFRLLILLTVVPILEIYFLMGLSRSIGWSNTILMILLTGIFGSYLIRKQGASVFADLQKNGQLNQLPADTLVKGIFTFIGGVLLVTPGVLTDVLGFSLILPGTQTLWKRYFMGAWQRGVQKGSIHFYTNMNSRQNNRDTNPFHNFEEQNRQVDSSVIDVEVSSRETISKEE